MPNTIIYFIYKHNNNKCLLIFRQNIKDRKNHI